MTDIAELGLKVDSRGVIKATKDLDKLERQGGKTEKRAIGMGRAFGNAFGALAAGALFKNAINNTIEQERVTAQLNQTLKSTGRFAPELSQSMQDYAATLQQVTTYGDEAVIASQAMLLTFTRIGNEEFPRAQEAILDVATAMNIDLKSAAIQVGKALNDPLIGLTALSRSGITFSESQKEAVKQMVAAGETAKAQRLILDELETQFGGSARAAREVFGGALKSLRNTLGDLLEGDGSTGAATQSINELNEALNDPNIKQGLDTMVAGFVSAIEFSAKAAASIAGFASWLGEAAARAQGFATAEDQVLEKEQELEAIRERIARAEQSGHPENVKRNQEILNQKEKELELLKEALHVRGQKEQGAAKPNVPVLDKEGDGDGGTVTKLTDTQKEAKRLQEQFDSLTLSISNQSIALGLTGKELAIFQAQSRLSANATKSMHDEVARLAGALYEQQALLEEQEALQDRAVNRGREVAAIYEATRTPLENLNSSLERYFQFYQDGLIDLETFTRAQDQAAESFNAIQEKAEEAGDSVNEFAVEAARNIQDQLGDGLFDIMQGNFDSIGDSFRTMLDRMVAEAIAKDLASKILGPKFGETGELGAGSLAKTGLDAASGFFDDFSFGDLFSGFSFDGGGFTGAGSRSGGVDGKGGFPAILHPNETVVDHTKSTTNNSQSVVLNQNFTVIGSMDRRSQAQIAQSAASGAQRVLARNG